MKGQLAYKLKPNISFLASQGSKRLINIQNKIRITVLLVLNIYEEKIQRQWPIFSFYAQIL